MHQHQEEGNAPRVKQNSMRRNRQNFLELKSGVSTSAKLYTSENYTADLYPQLAMTRDTSMSKNSTKFLRNLELLKKLPLGRTSQASEATSSTEQEALASSSSQRRNLFNLLRSHQPTKDKRMPLKTQSQLWRGGTMQLVSPTNKSLLRVYLNAVGTRPSHVVTLLAPLGSGALMSKQYTN